MVLDLQTITILCLLGLLCKHELIMHTALVQDPSSEAIIYSKQSQAPVTPALGNLMTSFLDSAGTCARTHTELKIKKLTFFKALYAGTY